MHGDGGVGAFDHPGVMGLKSIMIGMHALPRSGVAAVESPLHSRLLPGSIPILYLSPNAEVDPATPWMER